MPTQKRPLLVVLLAKKLTANKGELRPTTDLNSPIAVA